ncbi:MAG: PadR family transcriptional regulator [Chloroflexi bacterium HGW-Chloroflexi-2]|nr:MAG: PadR family transcriptional regulator [Chloroflexi bacterium HGW-Chloroflexi-2]
MPRHKRGWGMENGHRREKRRTPLKVALVEPALLTLISQSPRHGYSLLADLESLGLESLHPSVVYRTLRQMEDLEWIHSEWDTDNNQGPPRRLYNLTRIGDAALLTWREELVKAQDSIQEMLRN